MYFNKILFASLGGEDGDAVVSVGTPSVDDRYMWRFTRLFGTLPVYRIEDVQCSRRSYIYSLLRTSII